MKNEQRKNRGRSSPVTVRRCALIVILLVVNCSLLIGLDFSFRPKGFVLIPMGPGNESEGKNDRYSVGGGGELGFEIDLSTVWSNPLGLGYTAGLEAGVLVNALQGDKAENVSFYSFGGVMGLYYFPLSRFFTRVDGAVGVQMSARDMGGTTGRSDPGLFWRLGGEIGFRFTPGFTLAADTGWRQFSNSGSVANSGLYAGLTAQITFQTGKASGREGINASLDQYDAIYPAFMRLYQSNALGNVVLRNNENAEIRDVALFFRASGYTASEFPCGTVPVIPRGRSAELPLLADFSPGILQFTDSGRVLGELVIRYRFLGQERETVRAVTVATHNRNTVTGDIASLAAFISPTSPETLDFARFVAGLSRANLRAGHSLNMQFSVWFLEALRASKIRLGKTYADESEAQYPAETLSYRTGSARDLALLFSSGLEGVGIKSAFIRAEGDFLVALNLGIGQSAAETLFNGLDRVLVIDGEIWLPLSMSAFNEGFMACWMKGADVLNRAFETGARIDFVIVEEAWSSYSPAPLPELGRDIIRTDTEAAAREVNRAMDQYVSQELTPILGQVQAQVMANPTAALYNRLGILQARSGRIAEAKSSYERAAGMGSVPAMTNRGNIALVERDYAAAERWFRQALERDKENSAAKRGMEKIAGNR